MLFLALILFYYSNLGASDRIKNIPKYYIALGMYNEKLHFFRSMQQFTDCKMIVIPAKYNFKPYAYGFQKDSPYLPMFNYYLKEMREKGSLKQILDKYESPPQVCPDYNGKPLGFGAVFTSFGILAFGVILGIVLFLLEGFSKLTGKSRVYMVVR